MTFPLSPTGFRIENLSPEKVEIDMSSSEIDEVTGEHVVIIKIRAKECVPDGPG